MRNHVQCGNQRGVELLAQRRAADTEEHREDHNLQDLVIRHCANDTGWNGVGEEALQAHTAHGQTGFYRVFWHRQIQAATRMLQGDDKQAHQNRQHRRADKPDHRFTANATNRGGLAELHNPHGQGTED